MMKKIGAIMMCLMLVLGLAACEMPGLQALDPNFEGVAPPNVEKPPVSEEPVDQEDASSQPPQSEEPAEMTFDAFLETAGGIWILDGSVRYLYDDEYTYTFCSISREMFGGGVYPGGGDRPGMIVDFTVVGENTFELSLLYEAGEHMGDMLPEERFTLTVTFIKEGWISLYGESGNPITYFYGGQDLDQAQQAARRMAEA